MLKGNNKNDTTVIWWKKRTKPADEITKKLLELKYSKARLPLDTNQK